ncbi:M23 family metallopeptidase [Desulfonatronovibrio magnus]|uniref:M23 family metallopeptidase n=1 Tax=Desulfonatronovibrio magnus TaxID=698827 RepID=UPI0005EB1443|nr:M23 family metallopeptidase [Desulfonatronovibrio magnus]
MIFKKYQFVLFKEQYGTCSKISIPGWIFVLSFIVLASLIGSNIFFWNYYANFKSIEHQLQYAQERKHSQEIQISSFYHKVKTLEQDLHRVKEFDDRLRVMLDLEPEMQTTTHSVGGPTDNNFSKAFPFYRQEMLARKMHNFIEQLSTEARLEEVRQQELIQAIKSQNDLLSSTPSIWPTQGWVTSEFGYRTSPFTGRRELHRGLDISAPIGTPIYAPADGKVIFSGSDGAYGVTLIIDHGRGISTRYAHLQEYLAEKSQHVSRGELIAYVGNTGRSTGPHLHYEVRINNVPVNPKRYILN